MQSIRFSEIKSYKVVFDVAPVLIDPEETKKAIAETMHISLEDVLQLENLDELIEQHAVYPKPLPGEIHVSDDQGAEVKSALSALGEHERLDLEGGIIPYWVGTKYHLKTGSVWAEGEIADIGDELPAGAILPDSLTDEQRKEIAEQKETEKIAALSPEAKEAEKKARLDALADEADRLSRRAAIQGTDFDAAVWYQENKAPVELKYA